MAENPPEFAASSLNAENLRGPLLMTFLTDRFPESYLAALEMGTAAERLKQAVAEEAADLAAELPQGVELRTASMSVGRGAGTVLPAIEIWRAITDDAVRITFWIGQAIAFAFAVKRIYRYIADRVGKHPPLVSPEVLIQLSAAEVLESGDPPADLQFGSITSISDLHHAYSSSPYLPYDYGDVYVIVLTAGSEPRHVYGFVMSADGTIVHQWHVRIDFDGHPV
jgi:hypothetical protein